MVPTFCDNLCWIQTHALGGYLLPVPSLNPSNAQNLNTLIFEANLIVKPKPYSFPLIHGNFTDACICVIKKWSPKKIFILENLGILGVILKDMYKTVITAE